MIKAIKGSVEVIPKNFPKLMASEDTIVLFSQVERGTVVHVSKQSAHKIGQYSDDWVMSFFTDYNDSLTLQNE